MTMGNWLEAWRNHRARSRGRAEGKHLISEVQKILKRKGHDLPESVVHEIGQAIAALQRAIDGQELEPLRQTLTALDEKVDQHLAFARKSTTREYVESILVAVSIALFLRAFVFEAFQIPSGSMIPTLEIGDHIFVSKFAYGLTIPFTNKKIMQFREPQRGDVIVFKYPLGQETDYIKRVVGLPGDKLEIHHNEIFVNGNPMPREHSTEPCQYSEGPRFDGMIPERDCDGWIEHFDGHTHRTIHEVGRTGRDYGPNELPQIAPDHVFVMGDNRDNSNDSRVWGTVPYELIKGRALVVWWSRGPTRGELSPAGFVEWVKAIRWSRFFHVVE
jgi:signal peptidase I